MTMILPHIKQIKPYVSGIQPATGNNVIQLNLNENPYAPSPNVLNVFRTIKEESLRLYPNSQCDELRRALAGKYDVKKEQTFCGNGSSEIISLLFTVFLDRGHQIAIPDPSFALYYSIAAVHQVECLKIPVRYNFSIDTDALITAEAKAIVLVNPNAPTGLLLPPQEVERIAKHFSGLVIVDEAYIDFAEADSSIVPLIKKYKNLIVLRTFSKAYSLCGVRVGYCFADEALISALEKGKNLYNVNFISQQLALAALLDEKHLKTTTNAVKRTRDDFIKNIRKLGFNVIQSQTNFVLCSPPAHLGRDRARKLYNQLLEKNIYVRYFEDTLLYDKLRISIGTEEEMKILYDHLKKLMESTTFNNS
ncbi:histidinol-phosphate transaminase [Metabacillus fastidiosus]|uniref:histidinol-phosphate transaminase n=1 Tax=Metabacillus fastidiosus TaxID=1458 RepID=UPI002E216259|nr:histidinol-phosphate transaminase [Metabacillus fastidiosus]